MTGDGYSNPHKGSNKIFTRALELKWIINKNFLAEHALAIPSRVETSLSTFKKLYEKNLDKREDFFIVDSDEFLFFDPAPAKK